MKKDCANYRRKAAKCMLFLVLSAALSNCTYNISMAHTQGTATDTIDDTASDTPTVSPTISPTISVIPKV
jgi:hypothetical protein